MAQCKAYNRQGERCTQPAVRGAEVCRHHGGAVDPAVIRNRLQRGAQARHIPETLKAQYEELLADPDLLNMDGDIALARTIVQSHLESWQEGGGAGFTQEQVDILLGGLERVTKLIERRERTAHVESKTANAEQLVAWVTHAAILMDQALEEHVSDAEERANAARHVKAGMARLLS